MTANKPSLLICTPAYGGLFTMQYLESLLETWQWLGKERIPVGTYFMQNESLITRARNTCAAAAMSKFDKLLFIDADIGWKPADVAALYYSERKIIGGLYPHKTYPIKLNFNARATETPVSESGEVAVDHIATGFLMIDCAVLKDLSQFVPKYKSAHMNGQVKEYYDLFRCGADLLVERGPEEYLSEDWFFCELAKAHGYQPYANVNVRLTHTGTHVFRPEHENDSAPVA